MFLVLKIIKHFQKSDWHILFYGMLFVEKDLSKKHLVSNAMMRKT